MSCTSDEVKLLSLNLKDFPVQMENTNPRLIILLLIVVIGFFVLKILNPHKQYSTQAFWETATLTDVDNIPAEALAAGNDNGPVLMWAATTTQDPAIIDALVARGADINEVDGVFLGTPLSGAASYNGNTQIIDTLLRLGADIDAKLQNNNSILIAAAMYNEHEGIIDHLVERGADLYHTNDSGEDALDMALKLDNQVAINALNKYLDF